MQSIWGVNIDWPSLDRRIVEEAFIRWGTNEGQGHLDLHQHAIAHDVQALTMWLPNFARQWRIQNAFGPHAAFAWNGACQWLLDTYLPLCNRASNGYQIQTVVPNFAGFGANGSQTSLLSKIAFTLRPDFFIPYDRTVREGPATYYLDSHLHLPQFRQRHACPLQPNLTHNYGLYLSVLAEMVSWLCVEFALNGPIPAPERCPPLFTTNGVLPIRDEIIRQRIIDKYLMVVGGFPIARMGCHGAALPPAAPGGVAPPNGQDQDDDQDEDGGGAPPVAGGGGPGVGGAGVGQGGNPRQARAAALHAAVLQNHAQAAHHLALHAAPNIQQTGRLRYNNVGGPVFNLFAEPNDNICTWQLYVSPGTANQHQAYLTCAQNQLIAGGAQVFPVNGGPQQNADGSLSVFVTQGDGINWQNTMLGLAGLIFAALLHCQQVGIGAGQAGAP